MILKVFSVFDSKLASFSRPWYEMTEASAIRVFADAVNDGSNPNNQWYKHPEDFSLFVIGEFDDAKGVITSKNPLSLVTASAIFKYVPSQTELDFFDKNGKASKAEVV